VAGRRDEIEIDGLKELRARLRNVADGIKDLKRVNKQAADIVSWTAIPSAPYRRGLLAATGRTSATATSGVVRFGNALVPYSLPVHWGWYTRPNEALGWRGGPIARNAWVSDAAVATQPIWYEEYVKEIERLWDL
jgi:hypothetical protein